MKLKNFTKNYKLKEKYDFDCAVCGHNQGMNPSILMELGMNSGSGRCLRCKEFLRLEVNEKKGIAVSKKREGYLTPQGVNSV